MHTRRLFKSNMDFYPQHNSMDKSPLLNQGIRKNPSPSTYTNLLPNQPPPFKAQAASANTSIIPTRSRSSTKLSKHKLKFNSYNPYSDIATTQTNSNFSVKNVPPTQISKSNSSISAITPIAKQPLPLFNSFSLPQSPNENSFVSKYNALIESDPHLFSNNNSKRRSKQSSFKLNTSKSSSAFSSKPKHKAKISKCLHCKLNYSKGKHLVLLPSHDTHLLFKQSEDINKLLLEAKNEMKQGNFIKAEKLLRGLIGKGYFHSDLFYLYGELRRMMKYYQEAEDYLLMSLKFKHHSYYPYFSLGKLYQETSMNEHSNEFYKKFLEHHETADAHFQMAKNFAEMKQYLIAAESLTKAIKLKPECVEYYQFRAEIYQLIGMAELSNDDINLINALHNDD